MYLPTELHDQIHLYLAREDLPTYRLLCKDFARHGAAPLFRHIRFRTSLAELRKLANIARHAYLGHCVEMLLWDTNHCGYEAQSLIEGLRLREIKYVLDGVHGAEIGIAGGNEEEPQLSSSIGVFILQAVFSGMPNLRDVYVLADGYPAQQESVRWEEKTAAEHVSDYWFRTRQSFGLVPRSMRHIKSNGIYEVQTALVAAELAGCPLSEVRAGYVNWKPLPPEMSGRALPNALAHLRRLHIVLKVLPSPVFARNGTENWLREALRYTTNLCVFELRLSEGSWWQARDHRNPLLRLQDVFSSPAQLPALNDLILVRFDTSEEFLLDFLIAHATTLRALKMQDMSLDPPGSWLELLQKLRSRLELKELWLNGTLYATKNSWGPWWDLNGHRGRQLERYLMNEAVIFPLNEANKWQDEAQGVVRNVTTVPAGPAGWFQG